MQVPLADRVEINSGRGEWIVSSDQRQLELPQTPFTPEGSNRCVEERLRGVPR